jgi:hypothetical protein
MFQWLDEFDVSTSSLEAEPSTDTHDIDGRCHKTFFIFVAGDADGESKLGRLCGVYLFQLVLIWDYGQGPML